MPIERRVLLVIVAGCLIAMVGFGIRSVFGLFLEPITVAKTWSRETFALAMALQNLLWGVALPIAGALADRYGSVRVIAAGALMYAAGIAGMATSDTVWSLHLFGGILTGIGIAFTAFTLALAAMAKVVGPERRSMVLGLGTAAGSFGQVIFSPLGLAFISAFGWYQALMILAATSLLIIPLAFALPHVKAGAIAEVEQSLVNAVREALVHRGYVLLTCGFFVCGFQVAFITVHFPAYITDLGFPASVGAASLLFIGLFNILGSFFSGLIGQRWSKKYSLSWIYLARALAIIYLLWAPLSITTVYIFSIVMGVLWLSTVPLTVGIVTQVFGARYLATLFGIVFFSHQLGSFLGVWLGGRIYDLTGSYELMWWAGIGLGVLAALVHLPINERPIIRPAVTSG